eukprot:3158091-Amphidinium_carterae.2
MLLDIVHSAQNVHVVATLVLLDMRNYPFFFSFTSSVCILAILVLPSLRLRPQQQVNIIVA